MKALYPAAVIGCRVFFWARAMANDHRLDIYVDATTYMALKQRASDVDRSISQHIRFLIKQDMLQALTEERNSPSGNTGGMEGNNKAVNSARAGARPATDFGATREPIEIRPTQRTSAQEQHQQSVAQRACMQD